jgi:hypothetical protein
MMAAFKQGQSVSLRNFGTFYVRPERSNWVFKFNPSQRLRKLLGWSSTYKGKPWGNMAIPQQLLLGTARPLIHP